MGRMMDSYLKKMARRGTAKGQEINDVLSCLGEAWGYTGDSERHVEAMMALEGTPQDDEDARRLKAAYDRLQEVFASIEDLL